MQMIRRQGAFPRGPNLWPERSGREFRRLVMECHARVLELNEVLLGNLKWLNEEGLMDAEGRETLKKFRKEPVANLKLLHYPLIQVKGLRKERS